MCYQDSELHNIYINACYNTWYIKSPDKTQCLIYNESALRPSTECLIYIRKAWRKDQHQRWRKDRREEVGTTKRISIEILGIRCKSLKFNFYWKEKPGKQGYKWIKPKDCQYCRECELKSIFPR